MQVNIHERKANFSKLLQRALLGDEIIITKAGVPMVKLVPVHATQGKRSLGFLKGEIWMAKTLMRHCLLTFLLDF